MQVKTNFIAISNASKSQEMFANNIANINTNGFTANRAVQTGDKLNISLEARAAMKNSAGVTSMSTTDPAHLNKG